MTDPHLASSDDVPDVVLEELMAAFDSDQSGQPQYDFDDPSIDRLLGLGDDDLLDDDLLDEVEPDRDGVEARREPTLIRIGGDESSDDDIGERSTIVISDLDDGEVIDLKAQRAGGSIDPRLRARRIAVRRAEGRRRLVWVAAIAVVVLVAVGAVAVLASSWFAVTTVDVEGAVYTDPAILQGVIDDMMGEPVLLVDTKEAEKRLEQVPWVESAKVSTEFPHRVVIQIRERTPIATFQGTDAAFRVIDRDGRVLDVITAGQPIAYMLITGTNPDTDQGLFAGAPYAAAAQLVIALPPEVRALTESVGVDASTGDLSLRFSSGIDVSLGASANMPEKLARLLQKVRDGLEGIVRIDVTTTEVSVTNG